MELIDIYNEQGEKTGISLDRHKVHSKGLLHRAICVWIVNSNNEILLQRRSSHVMFPDLMDISFSGHIQSGESPLDAVLREGKEELGIHIEKQKLQYLFSCRICDNIDLYFENEIDDVYLYRNDIPIEQYLFCDNEVQSVVYVPFDEFRFMVKNQAKCLVPYKVHYHFFINALANSLHR